MPEELVGVYRGYGDVKVNLIDLIFYICILKKMRQPRNFDLYVRQITMHVFEMSGQPMTMEDMHTAVNIVLFFARIIHYSFLAVFLVVFGLTKIHGMIKTFIDKYPYEIIGFFSGCLLITYVTDDQPFLKKSMSLETMHLMPVVILNTIGKFLIVWSYHYMFHLSLMFGTYIAYGVFMSFMRHSPSQ